MKPIIRGILTVALVWLWLPNDAFAATCDVANPVVPCEVGDVTYDTFVGNYSGNRSFYRASSYDVSFTIQEPYLCLILKDGLPHTEGYAFVANYGATVWTSRPPTT